MIHQNRKRLSSYLHPAGETLDIVYPKGTGFISVRLALPSRKLEYKMGGMPGLYGPGRRFAKTLLASEVAEFRKLFASLKFFTVPKAGEKRAQGKDGEFWTVSAEEGGKKHVVTRLEPRADPYQAGLVKACDWLGSAANR